MRKISMMSLLALFLFLASPIMAEQHTIKIRELKTYNIDEETFNLLTVNDEGIVLAFDRASFEQKKRGVFFNLYHIETGNRGQIFDVKRFDLRCKNFDLIEFSNSGKELFILQDDGLRLEAINIETGASRWILNSRRNEPGFRFSDGGFFSYQGELYGFGQEYTADRIMGPDVMVSIDPNSSGLAALTEVESLFDVLTRKTSKLRSCWFGSPSNGILVYGQFGKEGRLVKHWSSSSSKPEIIDEVDVWINSWGEGDRAVYSVLEKDGTTAVKVFNGKDKTQKVVYTDPDPARFVTYVLVSKNGETVTGSRFLDESRTRVALMYANSDNNWNLEVIPGAERVHLGTLRLSPDGTKIYNRSKKGIEIYDIP